MRRKRSADTTAAIVITARMTTPCSQGGKLQFPRYWTYALITVPVDSMTRTPGHQAAKPAKKLANGPNALYVQRYIEPSPGKRNASWPVTIAPGIRKVTNPRRR